MAAGEKCRWGWRFKAGVGFAALLLLLAVYPCYLTVQAARDRVRRSPHVFSMGVGFAGGYSYSIEGTGEPAAEVERLIGKRVDDWVAQTPESLGQSCESIARVSPRQRQYVYLGLKSPTLVPQILGRLHEFPRHEFYGLHLSLAVDEFTPAGFAALAALTNVDGISLGPRARGVWPERKLAYNQISESNLAQIAKLPAIKELAFSHVELSDGALRSLDEMENLTHLTLADVRIGSAGLVHLGALKNLTSLSLLDLQVPDEGFSGLRELANLERLWIADAPVSDANIANLSGLSNLACLHLDSVEITDAALAHLEGLSNLRELSLYGTQVTDAGLSHLRNLVKLDWLCLSETRATPEGIARLKRSLPTVRIRE